MDPVTIASLASSALNASQSANSGSGNSATSTESKTITSSNKAMAGDFNVNWGNYGNSNNLLYIATGIIVLGLLIYAKKEKVF